ncbi:cell envelope integrity protein CreD [Altererythrobacter lutimaris]|uniref:Cell envelope integrity protein CreD n=1 Tax=Altererythrobacter lutimaris TaxID=2743979 RepID=A0A850H3Z1_9SPHN|nr:cell envelope integrity protein CreD [Altererythrobacter lutimaris]NVE93877.1 cell envelope integrity protein CreD [Altererythrobacter lutimaris]
MSKERSPGMKLLFAGLVGAVLIIPLIMVYALVSDRQHQARIAQDSIAAGWAGPQVVTGPLLVIPYRDEAVTTEVVDGKSVTRTVEVRKHLYLSAERQDIDTNLAPDIKKRAIYETVIYTAAVSGKAQYALPEDIERFGVKRDQLILDEVEVRLGVSDPRGLQTDSTLRIDGEALALKPGKGQASTGNSGVHAYFDWSEGEPIDLAWSYNLRGSRSFSVVPSGNATNWSASSEWPHPSFTGSFLPGEEDRELGPDGFKANWSISNLALGQSTLSHSDDGPQVYPGGNVDQYASWAATASMDGTPVATIGLIEPVDLYSQVDRAVKYGFLFIGFTFLVFLMFDIVAGARVATAEYLLTGAGLVLFFVLLLAFAEVIGFALAYIVASAAIIGLLTAYSAAVLGSWTRAGVVGAVLVGLYALLFVLLNLEALSLIIGSLMLFFALAGVMYATRGVDWSGVALKKTGEEGEPIIA